MIFFSPKRKSIWYMVILAAIILMQPRCRHQLTPCESKKDAIEISVGEKSSVQMVHIPPGRFKMGRKVGLLARILIPLFSWESAYILDDGPSRLETVTNGYYISKYKVTCQEYCEFLNNFKYDSVETLLGINKFTKIQKTESGWTPKHNMVRHPISTVEWLGAVEYCRWLSKKTGMTIRLPSEKEWELAARGCEGRIHPWGDDEASRPWWALNQPVDWHSSNITPQGVVGMVSAVYGEWCKDVYPDRSRNGTIDSTSHVLRGRGNHGECTYRTSASKVRGNGIFTFRIIAEEPQS